MALDNNGGIISAPNRAPAAKVIAGALANSKVARSLIAALGSYSFNSIFATSASQITDFGGLFAGDLMIHLPANPGGDPTLLTAATYGVLAKSAITTVNPTTINGDLGESPGSSVTGAFTITGATNEANAAAAQAQVDANAAFVTLSAHAGYVTKPNVLDGQSLTAGYYTFGSGDVTL